ncbi:hypothetical protein STEG23_011164 [Scotinomys teguina]
MHTSVLEPQPSDPHTSPGQYQSDLVDKIVSMLASKVRKQPVIGASTLQFTLDIQVVPKHTFHRKEMPTQASVAPDR